jgi:transcriptional regulator with XRE-family HTH domain
MDTPPTVEVTALYAALDAARNEKGLSWRQLAKEVGISPSTMSRMANGYKPDLTAFASMTTWLRMPAETFYTKFGAKNEDDEPELTAAVAPLLRARKDLNEEDVAYLEELIAAAAKRFKLEKRSRDF